MGDKTNTRRFRPASDGPFPTTPGEVSEEELGELLDLAEDALADGTILSYRYAWRSWTRWCEARGAEPFTGDPRLPAYYLLEQAKKGRSRSSCVVHRAAIAYHHEKHGHPNPCGHPGMRAIMRGLGKRIRKLRGGPKQARPLTADMLPKIEETAPLPRTLKDGRRENPDRARRRGDMDLAIIHSMRDAMLRAGEAAAATWDDVNFKRDPFGREICTLDIRKSKTDQAGTGATLFLGPQAAKYLRRIRPARPGPGRLIFGSSRGRTLNQRIQRACGWAGLGEGFSGHSCRVGMCVDLALKGNAEMPQIMEAGRWRKTSTVATYLRGTEAERNAVAIFHGSYVP